MDIVGHCVVAELSGIFEEEEIYGPGIVELMLPNYVHCHDWAYRHCWEPQSFSPQDVRTVELLRAHIINDWVVHYGTERTHIKEKCGWAFRRSGYAESIAVEFFSGASRAGLLQSGPVDASAFSERQLVDFGHTFTEYAGDILLAQEFITPERFTAIQDGFALLERDTGKHSASWVLETFERLGMTSDRSREFIEESIRWTAHDAKEATSIREFPVRTAMRKWKFNDDEASRAYIREALDRVSERLDVAEVRDVVAKAGAIVASPQNLYSGAWVEQGPAPVVVARQ